MFLVRERPTCRPGLCIMAPWDLIKLKFGAEKFDQHASKKVF